MEWQLRHLRWLDNPLPETAHANRLEKMKDLPTSLQSIRRQGRQLLVTLDKSWFYFTNEWEQLCLPVHELSAT
jgi:hypothetical protein